MSTVPKLSYDAILTVFNAEDTISRALTSILEQDLPAQKIFVIDDFSTDNSLKLLNDFAQQDSRIQIIKNESNRGQSYSRNLGASLSVADLLIFFDDDDFSSPNRANVQVKILSGSAQVSYVSSKICYPNGYIVPALNSIFNGTIDGNDFCRQLLLGKFKTSERFVVASSTLAIDRELFNESKGFDEQLRRLEDVDFALKVALSQKVFCFSSEILVDRYSTISSDKGSGQDMIYEQILLERYRSMLSNRDFDYAIKHVLTRRYYFARSYFKLFFHLLISPSYSIKFFFRINRIIGRFAHEMKKIRKI